MMSGLHGEHVSGISPERIPEEERGRLASRTMRLSMGVTVLIGIIELAFWFFSTNILFMIEGAGNLAWYRTRRRH